MALLLQRFQDRAFAGRLACLTGRHQPLERALDASQITYLRRDICELRVRARFHGGARCDFIHSKFQEVADLLKRETQTLGASDEPKPLNRFRFVLAVAGGRPRRRCQQSLAFVVPDGLYTYAEASLLGELSDGQ